VDGVESRVVSSMLLVCLPEAGAGASRSRLRR
jgi:hypothetical protein